MNQTVKQWTENTEPRNKKVDVVDLEDLDTSKAEDEAPEVAADDMNDPSYFRNK